jgi:transcriptional regulator with GAF, ATPase, and Fis domain
MTISQRLLSRTFVQLADSLVDEFDIVELLTLLSFRCVELFDSGAAGILLGRQRGSLEVVAASTEQARLLELFQLQNNEGPCLDCHASGVASVNRDLEYATNWPLFAPVARDAGFRSVQAFPLRLREEVIGTLNIFVANRVVFDDEDLGLCQALADVATIAVLQNQKAKEVVTVNGQLQRALDSRIAIEQAKGILAERAQVDMTEAFARLRHFARDNNRRLSDVASAIVAGELTIASPVAAPPTAAD